ncbi:terminase TerL endonuclease subunit [Carboxylicivirga sp. RSCT41]|uniref:terminase TerL endonuclease subunit n=1 Tax=Carboxylicivirga agarovorans TaxID=3417570 RepID=UPI003D335FBA
MKPLRLIKESNVFEDEVIKRAFQYEDDVLSGKIAAGEYLIKAIKRSQELRKEYNYNELAFRDIAILFYHMYIPIQDRPTQFLPDGWQCWILLNLFAILTDDNKRLHTEGLVLVARKSGKTMFGAAIMIAILLKYGGMSGELFGAATVQKQAQQLMNYCKVIIRNSPMIKKRIKQYRDELHFDDGYSLHVLSQLSEQQADKADGKNCSACLYDEGHAFKTADLKQVVITGMGARANPLFLTISTTGFLTIGYPLYEQVELAKKVLNGKIKDDATFYAIYQLDSEEEAKSSDISVLEKANPGLGSAISESRLLSMRDKALLLPSSWKHFLVKNANIFQTSIEDPFIALEDFEKCCKSEIKLEEHYGARAWIGLDLSTKVDLTAMTVLIEDQTTKELQVYPFHYFPSRKDDFGNERNKVVRANGADLQPMIDAGFIKVHENRINYDLIYHDIKEIIEHFDVQIIGYDPYSAEDLVNKLKADIDIAHIEKIPVSQSITTLSPPSKLLEELVISENINFGFNPALKYCNSNARIKFSQSSNLIRVIKDEMLNPIDSIISTIISLALYMESEYSTLSHILDNQE